LALLIASFSTFAQKRLDEIDVSRRALLWTTAKKWDDASLRSRRFSCHRISNYKTMIYIECFGLSGKQLVRALAELKGVEAVSPDRIAVPVQHALPDKPYAPTESFPSGASDSGCRLSETCENGRAKYWAQERMDADLMFSELKRMGLPDTQPKVAVIDSGFDMSQARKLMTEQNLSVAQGWDGAGDPNEDETGHGTAVAGLIGGKDGIGLAPQAKLSVYRVNKSDQNSVKSTAAILQMSAMRACDDGNEVINMSWSYDADEDASRESEVADKKFLDELAAKGCLLVKSAGNRAKRVEREHMKLDDAILRVEAIAPNTKLATFSSNGEVAAPGAGVFTLWSSRAPASSSAKACGGHPGTFIDGTSFSAPLTSAVATQVLGILKLSDSFRNMDGPSRVSTLNRIVAASANENGVNALRAVMMAEMLVEADEFPVDKPEKIRANFQQHTRPFCDETVPACTKLPACDAKRGCAQQARKHVSLCRPPRASVVSDLSKLANALQANEVSMALRSHLAALPKQEAQKLERAYWDRRHGQWKKDGKGDVRQGLNFDEALGVLPALLSPRSKRGLASDSDRALADFLTSQQLQQRLGRDLLAGSQQDVGNVLELLKMAQETMPRGDFLKLMQDTVDKNIAVPSAYSYAKYSDQGVVSMARLLDALIEDPRFEGNKEKFIALERSLVERVWNSPLSGQITNLDHLDNMFSRNSDLLWRGIKQTVSTSKPVDLKSPVIQYLVRYPEVAPKSMRADFVLRVLESHDKALDDATTPYGGIASAISSEARQNLRKIVAEAPAEERQALLERYHKLGSKTENPKRMLTALPNVVSPLTDNDWKNLKKDPLFSEDIAFRRGEELARKIIAQPRQWNALNGSAKKDAVVKLGALLGRDPQGAPLLPKLALSVVNASLTNTSAADWGYAQTSNLRSEIETIQHLLSEPQLKSRLRSDADFLQSIERLRADALSRSARYGYAGKSLLKSIDSFLAIAPAAR
jgi:hypothetical protein